MDELIRWWQTLSPEDQEQFRGLWVAVQQGQIVESNRQVFEDFIAADPNPVLLQQYLNLSQADIDIFPVATQAAQTAQAGGTQTGVDRQPGEVIEGAQLHPSLAGKLFIIDANGIPKEISADQAPLPTEVQLPSDAFLAQLPEGMEAVFDVRTQQWVPQRVPDRLPLSWQQRTMELLSAEGVDLSNENDPNVIQARQLWSFYNQMDPGAKVELALQLSTAPGDFVTYWSALQNTDLPNVGFELGVRRFPLAQLLVDTVADALNLPIAQDPEGNEIGVRDSLKLLQEQSDIETAPADGVQTPPTIPPTGSAIPGVQQQEPIPSGFDFQAEDDARRGILSPVGSAIPGVQLPRPQPTLALKGPQVPFGSGFRGPGGPEEGQGGNPPGILDAKIVMSKTPVMLGENPNSMDLVISMNPQEKLGFTPIPFESGQFQLLQGEARSQAIGQLGAFGQTNQIAQPRLVPSRGTPLFRSNQQRLQFQLPSEREGFRSAVAQTGVPIQDFLEQERQVNPQFGARPALRFRASRVSSAV